MINVTGDALLEDKLLKIVKTENEDLLRSFVINTLNGNREQAIAFFGKIIEAHQGKMRFKILEVLMHDAGEDLVPLMISAIRREKNVLFAKSLMFLYGNFEHSSALTALMTLEEEGVHFDLQRSFQKVSAKLKARFRELFYIDEFQHGDRNPKRMNHAAEMMIKEPHEAYPPFLNGIIRKGNLYQRKVGCKVLAEVGDESSLVALKEAIPAFFEDRYKTEGLAMFLLNEEQYKNPKLADIVGTLGMLGEWSDQESSDAVAQIRAADPAPVLALIRKTLLTDDTLVTKDILRFISRFLEGGTPPKSELKSLERLLQEHADAQSGLIQEACHCLGSLGFRLESLGLLAEIEVLIPTGTRDKSELIASFLGGYKTPESMEQLLALLTPDQSPELITKVLASLEHYTFTELPEPFIRLAHDCENGLQRQATLSLIAKQGLLKHILKDLFESESTIVCVDAIQTIATYQVEAGYELLLEKLSPDLNPRLQEVVITALEAFPRERTGNAVKDYILLPNNYLVRFAALKTLYFSGGSDRIAMVLKGLAQYPEKNRPEFTLAFFKLVAGEWHEDLLKHLDFWRDLLNDELYEKVRPNAIEILDKVDWSGVPGEHWVQMLQQVVEHPEVKRGSQENKTLRIIILRIRAAAEETPKSEEQEPQRKPGPPTLPNLLERLVGANLHNQLRVFRMLNLHFKPDWFQPGGSHNEGLLKAVIDVFNRDRGLPELFKQAIALCAKIKHEPLKGIILSHLGSLTPEVVEYGRNMLEGEEGPAARSIHKILVLDDTVLIGKALQRFLTKSGFEVHAETHPKVALEYLADNPCDLLVLDLLMPEMNGFEFIKESREREVAPESIIMITSSRETQLLRQVTTMSINGLLLKPFPIQELLDRIQHL